MVWTQTPKEIENFIKILSSLEKTPLWIKFLFLGNNLIMHGKYSSCRFLENSTGFFEYSAEEIISPIGIIFFNCQMRQQNNFYVIWWSIIWNK